MTPTKWTPHEGPQTLALSIEVYEMLYGGARGGGKTEAGIMWLISDDYYKNGLFRGLVIRKNFTDLSDWVDRAERIYVPLGARRVGDNFHFPSGAKILTGHLKDKSAYEKYQGHEYQRMLIEELTHIPREEDYLKLIASCRSTVPGLVAAIFASANPTGRGHTWVKKRFVKGPGVPKYPTTIFKDPESGRTRIFIPADIEDNPTLIKNDPGYVNFLNSLPAKLRKAWRQGNWDITDGQFFEEWRQDVHVCVPFDIPKEWKRFICMDYGFAKPSAVYWCAVDPKTGRVYTYRELYVTQHTYEMLAEAICRLTPAEERDLIDWMVADSSIKDSGQETGRTGLDIMETTFIEKNWMLSIRMATKGPGSRKNGWNLVRSYQRVQYSEEGLPITRWQVFDTCVKLIEVWPQQMYDDLDPEDLDTDGEDHAPDAIRYGLRALNEPWDQKPKEPPPPPSNPVLTDDELYYRIEKQKKYRR